MAKNANLHNAKSAKNDEFYTQLTDIEKEMKHYRDFFRGKVVYCNCDDARESNFFKYFANSFEFLGLKKLITTGYKADGKGVVLIYEGDKNGNKVVDDSEVIVRELEGNGDFRSEECIEFLKEADVVCTNPPFSIWREYIAQLVEYNKKFIIIGNMNAITYKEVFPLIKENKLWCGCKGFSGGMDFYVDEKNYDASKEKQKSKIVDGRIVKNIMGCIWFTNVDHNKRHKPLDLYKMYSKEEYPTYDNYNAINVDKVADIPMDYDGVMGVPISFLDKYCPEQFEIVGLDRYVEDNPHYGHRFTICGKETYARILIKKFCE